jgi:hypothetical protein
MATLTCHLFEPDGVTPLAADLVVTITTTDGAALNHTTHQVLGGPTTITAGTETKALPDLTTADIEPAGCRYQIKGSAYGSLRGRTWYWDGHTDAYLDALDSVPVDVVPGAVVVQPYDDTDLRELIEAAAGGVSSYNDLTDVPATFPPSAHSHAYADLTGTPSIPDSPDDIGAEVAGAAAMAQSAAISAAAADATTKADAAQAFAVQRANHTGQQTSATISDLTEAVQDIVGATLAGTTGATVSYNDAAGTITITGLGDPETMRDTLGAALVGVGVISVTVNDGADTITISSTATQNSTDAALRDRSTHTGTQTASTISDLSTAVFSRSAPSYAGARTRPYDPQANIYASEAGRAKARRALGFTLGTAKTSLVNVLINGDSFSSGWKATTIGGAGHNEIQTVTITGTPTGGTFTLTFSGQTTAAIAYNATAATVSAALAALSNIGSNNVGVTGATAGPYTVMFQGALATTDVAQMTATPSLTGGTSPTVTVTTTVAGIASAPGDDWATNLIGMFREAGYPVTGGWVFAGVGSSPGDGRWTFSSGWNISDTGSNYAFTSGLAGRTATFTSNTAGTVLEAAWFLAGGTSVTWSLDGGAQTGTLSSASTTAPTFLTLSGLANTTHTITFTLPTGATYWAIGARCRATVGLSISNASIFGSHTTDWLPSAKAGSTFLNPYTVCTSIMNGNTPKLVLFALGANDMKDAGHTLSATKANLNTIIGGWQTAGMPVIQRLYPYITTAAISAAAVNSPLANGSTWDQFLSAVYDVADTNDTVLIDHSTVLGDSNTLVAGALMFSDNLHLLPAGQAAIARADFRALQNI